MLLTEVGPRSVVCIPVICYKISSQVLESSMGTKYHTVPSGIELRVSKIISTVTERYRLAWNWNYVSLRPRAKNVLCCAHELEVVAFRGPANHGNVTSSDQDQLSRILRGLV